MVGVAVPGMIAYRRHQVGPSAAAVARLKSGPPEASRGADTRARGRQGWLMICGVIRFAARVIRDLECKSAGVPTAVG
jgi:hypothetical protein